MSQEQAQATIAALSETIIEMQAKLSAMAALVAAAREIRCWACEHPPHAQDICAECRWICLHGQPSYEDSARLTDALAALDALEGATETAPQGMEANR